MIDSDVSELAKLGIETVVDLRNERERKSGRWTDHLGPVTEHHLPFVDLVATESDPGAWTDAAGTHWKRNESNLVFHGVSFFGQVSF